MFSENLVFCASEENPLSCQMASLLRGDQNEFYHLQVKKNWMAWKRIDECLCKPGSVCVYVYIYIVRK